jgi:hypothetical protein
MDARAIPEYFRRPEALEEMSATISNLKAQGLTARDVADSLRIDVNQVERVLEGNQ